MSRSRYETLPARIVSGGQSGVDRAALDAAIERGIPHGGWCPRGRWAEDGPIDARYLLKEADASDPARRTRLNVRDSDATLILLLGPLVGGTALTLDAAREAGRPALVHALGGGDAASVVAWLRAVAPVTLNVAGPRESEAPGIYAAARDALGEVLDRLRAAG